MAQTFKFELVSPEKVVLSGDAEQVLMPGSEGDMTILPGHAPVVSTLRPGVLSVSFDGSSARVFVKQAFAQVDPDRLTVLAEKAVDVTELTGEVLAQEVAQAEAELSGAADDDARLVANQALSALQGLQA